MTTSGRRPRGGGAQRRRQRLHAGVGLGQAGDRERRAALRAADRLAFGQRRAAGRALQRGLACRARGRRAGGSIVSSGSSACARRATSSRLGIERHHRQRSSALAISPPQLMQSIRPRSRSSLARSIGDIGLSSPFSSRNCANVWYAPWRRRHSSCDERPQRDWLWTIFSRPAQRGQRASARSISCGSALRRGHVRRSARAAPGRSAAPSRAVEPDQVAAAAEVEIDARARSGRRAPGAASAGGNCRRRAAARPTRRPRRPSSPSARQRRPPHAPAGRRGSSSAPSRRPRRARSPSCTASSSNILKVSGCT